MKDFEKEAIGLNEIREASAKVDAGVRSARVSAQRGKAAAKAMCADYLRAMPREAAAHLAAELQEACMGSPNVWIRVAHAFTKLGVPAPLGTP